MRANEKLIRAFDDLISQKEAEKILGVSDEWFRKKRREGKITGTPLSNNRNWLYSKTQIAQLLNLQP